MTRPESEITDRLRGFRFRLRSACPHCGYQGIMGWNDFKLPMNRTAFLLLLVPLALLGLLPALILSLVVHRKKRYAAECPSCGTGLLLRPNEAAEVKSTWGGAQFHDEARKPMPNRQVMRKAVKWSFIAASMLIGIVFVVVLVGGLLQKSGLSSESAINPGLFGRYTERDSDFDGRNFRELEVLGASGNALKFRVRVVGTAGGEPVERGELVAEARLEGSSASYRSLDEQCRIGMDFQDRVVTVTHIGTCGFDLEGIAAGVYEQVGDPDSTSTATGESMEARFAATSYGRKLHNAFIFKFGARYRDADLLPTERAAIDKGLEAAARCFVAALAVDPIDEDHQAAFDMIVRGLRGEEVQNAIVGRMAYDAAMSCQDTLRIAVDEEVERRLSR